MGSRYILSGVQLGMLIALAQKGNKEGLHETIDMIKDQYVGTSQKSVKDDMKLTSELFKT